jgi:S1-C subfamily serine protease
MNRLRPALRSILLVASALALPFAAPPGALARDDPAAGRPVAPRPALGADEQANIELFRRVSPSVVHITTLETQRDIFSTNVMQVPRGTGTGFVWDERGHIVTNFHVIQGGTGARVTLADQTTFSAKLVGAFPDRDLAVLRRASCRRSQSAAAATCWSASVSMPSATRSASTRR